MGSTSFMLDEPEYRVKTYPVYWTTSAMSAMESTNAYGEPSQPLENCLGCGAPPTHLSRQCPYCKRYRS